MVTLFSATLALAILDAEVAHTKGQSIKDTTKKNLICILNAYQKFCDTYLLRYFPCDNTQLCRFGQHLKRTFQSPDAVRNYQSGIRTCMAMLGFPVPDTQDRQIQMFTQGLKSVMPHAIKQAAPITPGILVKISRVVNFADIIEMVAWSAVLLGFYMFLRKSNLVPDTMVSFNGEQQFRRSDINMTGIGEAMMVKVRWSKVLQFREKILRYPVLAANNKAVCPVFWMQHMVNTVKAGPTDPLFAIPYKQHMVSLSANQLISRLRKWLKLVGIDQMQYSLHSLCRGRATFAYQSNLEGEMIRTLGGWSSDAYKRYIDMSMDERFESMKKFVEALNKLTVDAYI